ncbi:MAG TPA: TIGR03915 family putative DNA repair protein, partial [Burkholderiaceae bacterium]|nr:TIGR03915 family putative DNA repair protein [Burkholderiaceae bacterium]
MIDGALSSVTDWDGYSRTIRGLLAGQVAPEEVHWHCAGESAPDLFDPPPAEFMPAGDPPALSLPRAFVEAARDVFLHADPGRHALLHRMSARIARSPQAWNDPLHADRLRFDRMLHEVRREIHKMHAFVRFRPLAKRPDAESAATRYVAWFEPAHHVAERAAGFFARRYSTLHWTILTPRVSIRWNGTALVFGAGSTCDAAPGADAGEALWLDYYRSIFNPARVKVSMMKKEMPVRFWPNLPESAAIGPLIVAASGRQARMLQDRADESVRPRERAARTRAADVNVNVDTNVADSITSRGGHPIEDVRRLALRCAECPIAAQATQVVFGEGDPGARLMIVGEQPGDVEDLRGRPFQGPAGKLLRAAFDELGWNASGLWLTNAVKHFHH